MKFWQTLREGLRTANQEARQRWNNPSWTPYDNMKERQLAKQEEARLIEIRQQREQDRLQKEKEYLQATSDFQPIVDENGDTWLGTLRPPPPWKIR